MSTDQLSQRLCYTDNEGKCCVVIPTHEFLLTHDILELKTLLNLPGNTKLVNANELPQDRDFRDAWELSGDAVSTNLSKAKDIHLNKLRLIRNEKLSDMDIQYQKALEKKELDPESKETEIIALAKQELRDMPELVADELQAISSTEELKAFLPEMLL